MAGRRNGTSHTLAHTFGGRDGEGGGEEGRRGVINVKKKKL